MSQTVLTLDRYLQLLQQETEGLARVLDESDPAVAVPTCPGWSLADLGVHVGEVHRFFHWVVREHVEQVDDASTPHVDRPPNARLALWLREGAAELMDALREADPRSPAWSWTPQRDVAFVQRRMPHETSIHRWDAQNASGHPATPIDSDLAADGISEFFLLASAGRYEAHEPVAFRAIDTGHEWTASVSDGQMQAADGVTPASVVLTGRASDLLLVLWRRQPLMVDAQPSEGRDGSGTTGVSVDGDVGLARTFLGLVDLN